MNNNIQSYYIDSTITIVNFLFPQEDIPLLRVSINIYTCRIIVE